MKLRYKLRNPANLTIFRFCDRVYIMNLEIKQSEIRKPYSPEYDSDKVKRLRSGLCQNCDSPSRARGLCMKHYMQVYRAAEHEMELYPTAEVIRDMEINIKAYLHFFPDSVAEYALRAGYRVEKIR